MTALSEHLQRLFTLLESRRSLPVPVEKVLLLEVPRTASRDSRGRLLITEDRLRSPVEYAPRFDELLHTSLPWLNMSCYGLLKGSYIVAIELPGYTIETDPSYLSHVNYSGPSMRVVEEGWDVSEGLSIASSE